MCEYHSFYRINTSRLVLHTRQASATQVWLHFKQLGFEICKRRGRLGPSQLHCSWIDSRRRSILWGQQTLSSDGAGYSPNPSSRLSPATSSSWTLVSSNYTKSIICKYNHIIKRYVKIKQTKKRKRSTEKAFEKQRGKKSRCRWRKKERFMNKDGAVFSNLVCNHKGD